MPFPSNESSTPLLNAVEAITHKNGMKNWCFHPEELKAEVGFHFQFDAGEDERTSGTSAALPRKFQRGELPTPGDTTVIREVRL